MCKNMNEFELLVTEIIKKRAEIEAQKKELATLEQDLKDYMVRRKKENLLSKQNMVEILYRRVDSPKFNKNLFIEQEGAERYKQYLIASSCMRLNYCKVKEL